MIIPYPLYWLHTFLNRCTVSISLWQSNPCNNAKVNNKTNPALIIIIILLIIVRFLQIVQIVLKLKKERLSISTRLVVGENKTPCRDVEQCNERKGFQYLLKLPSQCLSILNPHPFIDPLMISLADA